MICSVIRNGEGASSEAGLRPCGTTALMHERDLFHIAIKALLKLACF